MPASKRAETDHPIQPFLADRWSPVSFADRDVSEEDLRSLFEAARWAASAFNEQPWRYLVARRTDREAFAKLLSCLVEANQAWARNAPVLWVSCARLNYAQNGKPNGTALHDLGLAAGNICAEATARGLVVHQMGGILPDHVRELYGVPDDAVPLTATAVGYLADELQERERAVRTRRPQAEFVFTGAWGEAY